MLMDSRVAYLGLVCILLAAIGCSGPVVTIAHTLPAAVGVTNWPGTFSTEAFSVEGMQGSPAGSLAAKLLAERMPDRWKNATQEPTAGELTVGGLVRVNAVDQTGKRGILKWESPGDEPRRMEVPSLARQVALEVHFVISKSGFATPLVTIETNRHYDSTADPRVRGELGLSRSDDPTAVPPTDEIVAELLDECVREFWQMVTPLEVREEITLRPFGGPEGPLAFKAVKRGDLSDALEQLSKAARRKPDRHNVIFDLAVVQEARGDLAGASASYHQAAKLSNPEDTQASDGARRVRLVMAQQAAVPR